MNLSYDFALWRKGWWETRWPFLQLLAIALLIAAIKMPWEGRPDLTGWAWWVRQTASSWGQRRPPLGEAQFLTLLSDLPGYVWWNWFYSLAVTWPIYAILMTIGLSKSLCSPEGTKGAAARFTFSLPISRRKAMLTHAAFVAVEIILSLLVASLIFPIAIRLTGRWFPFGSTVIYALLLALGGMVFISFAFLLIAVFNDPWMGMAVGIPVSIVITPTLYHLGLRVTMVDEFPWWHIYHLMSGEAYFRYGKIPWLGLLASLTVSALMMFAAVRIYERRDF